MRHSTRSTSLHLALCLALAGCSGAPAVLPAAPAITIDRQAFFERLAHPATADWTVNRLTNPEVDKLRAQPAGGKALAQAAMMRRVQALSNQLSFSSVGVASTTSTGKISSGAGYSFWTNEAYWVTEAGWFIKRNMTTGVTSAFQISSTDTFANTCLTISNDGLRAYAVSKQGRFFAWLTTTGAQLAGSPFTIGGTATQVTTSSCAPYIDALASRDDGQVETIYALSADGTLHRFYVSALHDQAPSTWSIARVQTYALPVDNTAPYTEVFRASPVVIGGKLVVGSWRSNSTNSAQDNGSLFYYDTGMNGIPASATATSTPGTSRVVSLAAPVWASAAVEFDGNLSPALAFVPTGYVVSMVDLTSGNQAQSVALLTSLNTATQGGPASGTLATYPYGTAGISIVSKSPVTNGIISIADTSAATQLASGWKDLTQLFAAVTYDNSTTGLYPIWGYMKYFISNADAVVGGTTRAILNAGITLKCTSSSNSNGNATPAPSPVQMFRVSNSLTNGTAWDSTNMTPATRPTFEDGAGLQQNTLNSHKSVELTNAGNSFQNGQTYLWGATGLVSATNQSYSFGMASTDLSYVNSASNNGQPSRISTPRFGTAQLQIVLSGQGISTPTMTTPVTIDSWNHRIYAVNTNTLYALSYASATGDPTATPYAATYFTERAANFSDAAQSYFALTNLGKSQGPVSGTSYVANDCAPLFTGSNIYVVDNFPGNNTASVNRFTPGLPPALQADTVTLSSVANGKRGSTYLVYDNVGAKLFAGSYDPAGQGQCWVLTQ